MNKYIIYLLYIMKNKILTRKHNQKIKKIIRKNNKTQKKHTQKKHTQKKNIQSMIGGKPKINFPYTYFILNFSDFSSHKTVLNPYLNGQTKACDMIALGQPPDFIDDTSNPFLKDINDRCILVLKYPDAFELINNLNLLDDISFLNKILGHAKLTYYTQEEVIGIFNVCLHHFDIILNPSGPYAIQEKISKPGYGTVLFNCILTSISFLKIPVKSIWLGIDVNNVNFEKLAWLYTHKGFNDPIVSNISPNGTFIQLTYNPLTDNVNDEYDVQLSYYETIDLHRQLSTNTGKEGIFSLTFNFDKSAILNLRLLPFLSFEVSNKTQLPIAVGIEKFHNQRETTGRLVTYTAVENNQKQIVYKLAVDLNAESQMDYTIGSASSVANIEGRKVFHTHPFINYVKESVSIAPPSGSDFNAFLSNVVNNTSNKPIPQFFSVISIEGIYICYITIEGYKLIKNKNIPQDISKNYEYPFKEREYNWSNYKTDPTPIDPDFINNNLTKYFTWFENVNKKYGNFFNIIFKSWNLFDRNTEFTIYYYNRNNLENLENSDNTKMEID